MSRDSLFIELNEIQKDMRSFPQGSPMWKKLNDRYNLLFEKCGYMKHEFKSCRERKNLKKIKVKK